MYDSSNTSTRNVLISLKGLILQFSELHFYIKITAFWDVLAYNFVIYSVFDTPATSFICVAEEAGKLKMESTGSSETLEPFCTKVYVVISQTNAILGNFKWPIICYLFLCRVVIVEFNSLHFSVNSKLPYIMCL